MARYRISHKAVDDINNIWTNTLDNWSVEQADRYYNLIFDEIGFIADRPLSGISLDHIKDGYRMARVKSHLIFYRVSEDDVIEVVRVLHKRMDIESKLEE